VLPHVTSDAILISLAWPMSRSFCERENRPPYASTTKTLLSARHRRERARRVQSPGTPWALLPDVYSIANNGSFDAFVIKLT